MIVILSVAQDLHSQIVSEVIRRSGFRDCYVVESDRIAQSNAISFGVNYSTQDRIATSDGTDVAISEARVVWLRRTRATQLLDLQVSDENARSIINNDCRGAIDSLFATHFHGKWISTPESTRRASDKIAQLRVAHGCGFRVPKTLVSQSSAGVADFFEECSGEMVVKTIVGASGPMLETIKIGNLASLDDAAFAAAPAIYQEYIGGSDHLRLNCFGDKSYAALIRSPDVDWRGNLNVPIKSYSVDSELHSRVRAVLDRLELEMGIVDLKITPGGEPVWLEVNPQGQFVFLDAFTDLNLAQKFAEYLVETYEGLR